MDKLYTEFKIAVEKSTKVLVIQAENPDGDSLGSSLALEEIIGDLKIDVTMYCAISMPKYLRYMEGWDRVTNFWPKNFDLAIIVDAQAATLLQKALTPPHIANLKDRQVYVLDHHITAGELPFEIKLIANEKAVATCELILHMSNSLNWKVNATAAKHLASGILSDSLGLTTPNTTSISIRALAHLVDLGTSVSNIELGRRELMRKSPEMLAYKGRLLQRVEYHLNGQLALIHIPWDEIETYSDQYNPSVLVLDEMRLVEGVKVAIALKTYPDTKITGKIRANPDAPIAAMIAGYFGCGGHLFSAGFKVYDEHYETIKDQLLQATFKALDGQNNETA